MRYLVEHGADKEQADCEGLTPLHYAAAGDDKLITVTRYQIL